jgi:small-conductance mechanosensitive channel
VYKNTLAQHLTAAIIFIASLIFAFFIRKFILALFDKTAKKLNYPILPHIFESGKNLMPILFYIPFYAAARYLILPDIVENAVSIIGIILITVCIVLYVSGIIKLISAQYVVQHSNQSLKSGIEFFADIIVWFMAALFVLNNLGFNINTLLAGLGIGGMAIALASQTLLGDLFNYFTILIDKPFAIGDNITINGHSGEVVRIGLKGIRILSADGEQIIVSNTDITKNVLKNYRVMKKRRKIITIGIKYETPAALIKEIPQLLKTIVAGVSNTEFVRAHFSEFAESSLNFELVFFVLSREYGEYMNKVQEVNFKILDEFASRKIGFAYPASSVYIEKSSD